MEVLLCAGASGCPATVLEVRAGGGQSVHPTGRALKSRMPARLRGMCAMRK